MDINSFSYDTEAYENGLPVSSIPGFGDLVLVVRGQLSDKAMAVRARLQRKAGEATRDADGQINETGAVEINTGVILEACLVGWENLTSEGKPLEFTPENAAVLLANKRFRIGAIGYALGKVEELVSGKDGDIVKN